MADDAIQDVKTDIEFYAKKLAVLLASSAMPEGVKDAWLALVPLMSAGQVARLLDILEAKYVNEKTKMVDETYRHELTELVREFKESDNEREVELIKQIDALI